MSIDRQKVLAEVHLQAYGGCTYSHSTHTHTYVLCVLLYIHTDCYL